MALIDEIEFHAKAGDGGAGVVRWRHEKFKEYAGASGGNGGKGGDVFVRAVRDINIMARHKAVKRFDAADGDAGANQSKQGRTGKDCIIDLPIGSVVTNVESGRVVELIEDGQTSKILHGGKGGLGNEYFKASTNISPEQSTPGVNGEEADFRVELSLIADAGLIGLPNAGKSSLLNALTHARAKVASYAFTTLDPHLGVLPGGYILADIPGLIEGASEGKGLGHRFLRHVRRTKMLLHLISLENEDVEAAYRVIRGELEKYGNGLTEKKEVIILTKTDLVDAVAIRKARKALMNMSMAAKTPSTDGKDGNDKNDKREIFEASILDDISIKKLADELAKLLQ